MRNSKKQNESLTIEISMKSENKGPIHISEVMKADKDGKTYKDIILERMRYFDAHGHPNYEELNNNFEDFDPYQ